MLINLGIKVKILYYKSLDICKRIAQPINISQWKLKSDKYKIRKSTCYLNETFKKSIQLKSQYNFIIAKIHIENMY